MKIEIKKLTEVDYKRTYQIFGNSYPDMSSPQERINAWFDEITKESTSRNLWGAFIDKQEVGAFITYDFQLNFRGQIIPASGIGAVAVDLLHKKEKVCKQMIEFYENYYRERGINLLVLYPFRPDFYKNMGFGLGSTLHTYSIDPHQFPKYSKTNNLFYATIEDLAEITHFYNQEARIVHGAMLREDREFKGYLQNPKMRCIIHRLNGIIDGYLFFSFTERLPHDQGSYDLKIKEMQYENHNVWKQFSTFLNSQSDQVKRIQYTCFDSDFYHYFDNPTNESKLHYHQIYQNVSLEKTGLMYKITNPLKFFNSLDANLFEKSDLVIRFELENELFPKNEKYILTYNFALNKVVKIEANPDLTIKMTLARFSSILMGALSFSSAVKHGLVEIDNEQQIDCVDKLLRTKNMPVGYNEF